MFKVDIEILALLSPFVSPLLEGKMLCPGTCFLHGYCLFLEAQNHRVNPPKIETVDMLPVTPALIGYCNLFYT